MPYNSCKNKTENPSQSFLIHIYFSYFSLPSPSVPALDEGKSFIADAIIIGIIAFAQSVSLATLMAKKHNYDIDANKVSFR